MNVGNVGREGVPPCRFGRRRLNVSWVDVSSESWQEFRLLSPSTLSPLQISARKMARERERERERGKEKNKYLKQVNK